MNLSASLAPKIASGIDEIDQTWGGLYAGGVYLVFGRNSSGRNHAAHLFLSTGAEAGRKVALVSSARRRDLDIQAAAVGFDLEAALARNRLEVLNLPGPLEWESRDDDTLDAALAELASTVIAAKADRVAVMDFTLPALYESLERLRAGFVRFMRSIESVESTLVLTMPEPASDHGRAVLDVLSTCMTGVVHTSLVRTEQDSVRRQLSLIPEVGHVTRRADRLWNLEEIVALADRVATPPALAERAPETFRAREAEIARVAAGESTGSAVRDEDVDAAPDADDVASDDGAEYGESGVAASATAIGEAAVQDAAGRLFDDRGEFAAELDRHFHAQAEGDIPFLLIAMRIDSPGEQDRESVEFEFMIDVVRSSLKESDAVFSDLVHERLVVLLERGDSDEGQKFFGRLRDTLRVEAPHHADRLLHSVSAIVVPDGTPFGGAGEFLEYVLDDDR